MSSSPNVLLAVGILTFAAVPANAQAQEITVTGRVVERARSSWIGGATVRLSGSPPFFTELDGRFRFSGVTPGRHTLTVAAMGYRPRSLALELRSDTTLTLELDPDPILLDSLLVRAGEITIQGRILDARTGLPILHAQATVQPGFQTVGANSGRFTVDGVPIGRAVTVLVEAVEYLPARIALITEADTTLTLELEPDPVGIRLVAQQVEQLEERSRQSPHTRQVIGREEMARKPGWIIHDMIRVRLQAIGRRGGAFSDRFDGRMACLYIDEVNVGYPRLLQGLTAGEVERVEIYNRGQHIRVYTKRFLLNMLQREPGTMTRLKWGFRDWSCR